MKLELDTIQVWSSRRFAKEIPDYVFEGQCEQMVSRMSQDAQSRGYVLIEGSVERVVEEYQPASHIDIVKIAGTAIEEVKYTTKFLGEKRSDDVR